MLLGIAQCPMAVQQQQLGRPAAASSSHGRRGRALACPPLATMTSLRFLHHSGTRGAQPLPLSGIAVCKCPLGGSAALQTVLLVRAAGA